MNRKYFGTDGIRGAVGEAPITPEFVLRVMGNLVEADSDAALSSAKERPDTAILDAYEAGTTVEQTVHPMSTASHIWLGSEMKSGEAKPGTVTFRRTFELAEDTDMKKARLYIQVDDEAAAFVNGKKVFFGGR